MKVLFVGNSHTYMNDMPALFETIMTLTTGEETEVTMLANSGRPLDWHLNEYFSLRYNLMYGKYDYCVIQQAAHPFPPHEDTIQYGTEIIRLCEKNHVRPVLFMTWAEKKHPENQQKMIDTYTELAKETGAILAPVGSIWEKVQELFPDIDLYYKDGEHASPYGDLLVAGVLVHAISGKKPVLPDRIHDFQVVFPDDFRFPKAEETKEAVKIPYDKQIGQKIFSLLD